MRNTLIASSVAAMAVVGLAGGAVFAAESSGSPATPSTTLAPGMDIFADAGITQDQLLCIGSNAGSIDMSDLAALTDIFAECGISLEQLMQIGQGVAPTTTGASDVVVASDEPVPPGTLDAATLATVFEIMGLDEATVDCLVEGEATAPSPTDDQSAEAVFIGCGVGPLLILDAIVALHEQSGATTAESTTTVAGAQATTALSSGNPMVDLLLEQLAAQGIVLDATQGQCLLDNIADFDPNDMASVISVLETCGIDIADLLPSS